MNNVKKSIGWADFTINPIKGLCPVDCKDNQGKSYCYARRMYKRFKWNPEIRYDNSVWKDLLKGAPIKIFVGSTIELFGPWVKEEWLKSIFYLVSLFPENTFIFLTKQPQNLPREWPDNCWVGFSATTRHMFYQGLYYMIGLKAKIRFASIEPLQESLATPFHVIHGMHLLNWVIIGQQTPVKASTRPKIEWVTDIVGAADKAGVPVWLKDNLWRLLAGDGKGTPNALMDDIFWENDKAKLRQEWPISP